MSQSSVPKVDFQAKKVDLTVLTPTSPASILRANMIHRARIAARLLPRHLLELSHFALHDGLSVLLIDAMSG
jgi:hypothetical protein